MPKLSGCFNKKKKVERETLMGNVAMTAWEREKKVQKL